MIADQKKVQTLINKMVGKKALINSWINELLVVADSPVAQGFLDNVVQTRKGNAL